MTPNQISREILDSAYKVHSKLGPGLLESAYRTCLSYELQKKGLMVEEEKPLPLVYEDIRLDCGYRLDMLVENKVIVELKTVDEFNEVHLAQLLTYLRFSEKNLGLLLNFYVKSLKEGIRRVIL
jgi:GxxExxY protein